MVPSVAKPCAIPMPKPMSCPSRRHSVSQCSNSVTHFKCHEHGLQRRVLDWHWIIENYHHAITSISFERAVVFDDDFTNRRMIVAQEGHNVFSVGALGEAGEAAQVAEERGYLPSMALQVASRCRTPKIRSATCGGRKRRSLPMRSISPTWSATRCFELLVEFGKLLGLRFQLAGSFAQLLEQTRILNSDYRLSGKVLHQCNLFVGEGLHLSAIDADNADQFIFFKHRIAKIRLLDSGKRSTNRTKSASPRL